jgi:secreted Zn-dependent insulinase-like peptidase
VLKRAILKGTYSLEDSLTALDSCSLEGFNSFRKKFYTENFVRAYFTGNLFADDAK